jgi:hypothetical protein
MCLRTALLARYAPAFLKAAHTTKSKETGKERHELFNLKVRGRS